MERIAQLRKHKGWSQQDLAVATGLHVQTISRTEAGYRWGPSQPTLKAIADALGVTIADLYAEPEPAEATS